MKQNKFITYLPVLLAVSLVAGIYLGIRLNQSGNSKNNFFITNFSPRTFNKLTQVIDFVEANYVDSIDKENLVDRTIQEILQELDPHSYYITADELTGYTEPLEGNFDGIGIEFMIQKDTVVVVTPLSGGPSESVGILAGDRIVEVNGEQIAGEGINNKKVMTLLRGKSGTKVNVGISRKEKNSLIDFTITRGKIPIHSVDVALKLTNNVGYVKISRFAKNTYDEFMQAIRDLQQQNIKSVIVDLRGNGGGYMHLATKIADEFLPADKLIVFTKGRARKKEAIYSKGGGSLEKIDVAILIDQSSASASEIVAGALQDNDRGVIIGRRSFGKGLVQEPKELPDGSAFRLTIARYYTPTGRCIQKPYGDGIDYNNDYLNRLKSGELINVDSINVPDSLKFTTPKGKIVFGGGGIIPDIFVPIDTTGYSNYYYELHYRGLFSQFSFDYADKKREKLLGKYTSLGSFKQDFKVENELLASFLDFAEKEGVEKKEDQITISKDLISQRLKAYIAKNLWKNPGFYSIFIDEDKVVERAIEQLGKNNKLVKN